MYVNIKKQKRNKFFLLLVLSKLSTPTHVK